MDIKMNSSIYGEKMQAKVENSTLGAKSVQYSNQYEPRPECVVERKLFTTNDCLDDLQTGLALLDERIRMLEREVSPVLENCDHQSYPRADRPCTSALNEKINSMCYFVDSLNEYVQNVRDRVRL
jgi:hypothetical protein